jgi:hypothetical protein
MAMARNLALEAQGEEGVHSLVRLDLDRDGFEREIIKGSAGLLRPESLPHLSNGFRPSRKKRRRPASGELMKSATRHQTP